MHVMLTLIYMCFIIFMLQQRPDFGRVVTGWLDPSLSKPVTTEMHTYDDNCDLDWKTFWDNFDHYYCVHLGNWFLASFVIRDAYMLHFWQLLDEIIELSVQHILPHFAECWWDHIIMDICLSNIPAITLGLITMDYLGIRRYDWFGREGANNITEWKIWTCHKRLGAVFYQ
jgi:phosphatidylserine synthase 2